MAWHVEFLEKSLEAYGAYEEARVMTQEVMHEDVAAGPEWDAAAARQSSALEAWSGLYREYADLLSEDGKASG